MGLCPDVFPRFHPTHTVIIPSGFQLINDDDINCWDTWEVRRHDENTNPVSS